MKIFSFPHHLRKVALLSAICFLGVFLNACKKDVNLQPGFESSASEVFVNDTVKIEVKTVEEDSVSSGQSSLSLFGLYNDSIFGVDKASFYTQVLLPFNGVNVAETGNFTIDSVILSLVYAGKFADEAAHRLKVFELEDELEKEKNYYSNDSLKYFSTPLADKQFTSNTEKEVEIIVPDQDGNLDTIEVLPQLRIELDPAMGMNILNQGPDGALANNEAFTNFFKGLYISPAGPAPLVGNNNILYFALTNSQSKLSIFFTETSSQTKKVLDLPINTEALRFNRYSHNYSSTVVGQALADGEDRMRTFVQSMAGVRPVIRFPELTKTIPQKEHYVINKAELILPVEHGEYKSKGIPEQLLALTSDSTGRLIFTEDILLSGSRNDGYYSKADSAYHFNVTRYIDGIINDGRTDRGLTVIANGSAINAQRVILNGPYKQERKMRLKLYYSKLD